AAGRADRRRDLVPRNLPAPASLLGPRARARGRGRARGTGRARVRAGNITRARRARRPRAFGTGIPTRPRRVAAVGQRAHDRLTRSLQPRTRAGYSLVRPTETWQRGIHGNDQPVAFEQRATASLEGEQARVHRY